MIKVGITGGIGSGKSTVCRFFELLGIPVYNSDLRARQLMENDLSLIGNIIDYFGSGMYDDELKLNRQALAARVFDNAEALSALNSLVHPAVFRDFDAWAEGQKAPYVLKEAAILFESGSYKDCQSIILVAAPIPLRIQRVMKRDGLSEEEIKKRMDRQMSDAEKAARSNFVLVNDDQQVLIPELIKVHQTILKQCKD